MAKRWETGRLSLTTTLGHERTYQAWAWVPQIVADPESTDEDILNWVQGSGEYDYGADTVRVQDMLDRRAQHNYYRYENEVDDYRQDHYQLHLDQTMGDWELGGVVFTTLGAGYYEQFRQGDDLSDYGFNPIVTNVLDTSGILLGADTVFTTDVVRRRWLDNTLLGSSWTMSTSTDAWTMCMACLELNLRRGPLRRVDLDECRRRCPTWRRVLRSVGKKRDLSLYGKWSGMQNDLRWHAEAQWRQVFYQTRGRDNDYSDIDVRDNLSFFNPKAG